MDGHFVSHILEMLLAHKGDVHPSTHIFEDNYAYRFEEISQKLTHLPLVGSPKRPD
jgi:hypothetical protein